MSEKKSNYVKAKEGLLEFTDEANKGREEKLKPMELLTDYRKHIRSELQNKEFTREDFNETTSKQKEFAEDINSSYNSLMTAIDNANEYTDADTGQEVRFKLNSFADQLEMQTSNIRQIESMNIPNSEEYINLLKDQLKIYKEMLEDLESLCRSLDFKRAGDELYEQFRIGESILDGVDKEAHKMTQSLE
jgi:hypothetical protein